MGVDLRIGRSGLGRRTSLAHDEFALVDANGFIFENVFKSQSSLDRSRNTIGCVAFVEFCNEPGSFRRYMRLDAQALLS